MPVKGSLRTCKQGHQYYKSSDCPVCPICEQEKKPEAGFLALLAAPARRALTNAGITTLTQLAKHTEAELLQLHGMGPNAMAKLVSALKDAGMAFRA